MLEAVTCHTTRWTTLFPSSPTTRCNTDSATWVVIKLLLYSAMRAPVHLNASSQKVNLSYVEKEENLNLILEIYVHNILF